MKASYQQSQTPGLALGWDVHSSTVCHPQRDASRTKGLPQEDGAQHRDLSFLEPTTAAQQHRDMLTPHTMARLAAPQGLGKEVAGAAVVSPSKQEA